jgi:hypothetical protein
LAVHPSLQGVVTAHVHGFTLSIVQRYAPECVFLSTLPSADYYDDKVRLLTEYAAPAALADDTVLRLGGTALLPRAMSQQLQPLLEQLRGVVDIQRPELADASEAAVVNWNSMVHSIMLGCAGLVHYLINAYPPDLPEYDPL